jgi:periplasmic protein TonB
LLLVVQRRRRPPRIARISPWHIDCSKSDHVAKQAAERRRLMGRGGHTAGSISRVEIALLIALSVTGHTALAVQLTRKRPQPAPPREQTVAIEVIPPPVEPPVVPPQEDRPRPVTPRPVSRVVTREPIAPPPPVDNPTPAADVDPGPVPQGEENLPAANGAPEAPPAPPAPLVAAHEGANYLKNPRPAYPELALQEGWEGQVLLRVKVSPDGRATVISVANTSGQKTLDDAAIEAVRGWSFVPARQGNVPLAGWVTVPIVFRLQQGE